ncbi:MAG: hypothetical protein OXK21_07360 [Chloroflexota bacterium]|nr:hypothetical protein [Chloroflexota bacterium]
MTTEATSSFPRYEIDERPPPLMAAGLGVQSALLAVAPIALIPILLAQAADSSDAFSAWAVFAMLIVNGAGAIVQAFRVGPLGAGLFIVPYPSPTTIPFCILALQEGGTGTLAALVVVSGVFQIALSLRMSLLRRVITPAVSGAILILLMITLAPVLFRNLDSVPDGAHEAAGPVCILVTFAVILGLLIRGSATWRVWASIIGIVAGSVAGAFFGIYDFEPAKEAAIAGLPLEGWPGLALSFDATFWALLPVFLFLSVVLVLQGSSITLSTQRVSWRTPRAMDFRRVQGAAAMTGVVNVASGLAAVMPITTSPRGVAFAQQTGCASRQVAVATGALIVAAAFFPKLWSLLLGIPDTVIAVYMILLVGPLIVEVMKLIVQDSPDYRTSLVIGTALTVGIGLQTGLLPLPIGDLWEAVLQKALTGGGLALVLLTVFAEFRRQRRGRIQVDLSMDELPRVNDFVERFAVGRGWSPEMTARVQAASEETMLVLQEGHEDETGERRRRLVVDIGSAGPAAELEFISVGGGADNLEDRIALLSKQLPAETELGAPDLETAVERDVSLRLMRHYATSVSHRQYFETEVVSLRVAPPQR